MQGNPTHTLNSYRYTGREVGTDGIKNRPKRNSGDAKKARVEHENNIKKKYKFDNPDKTDKEASTYAKNQMKTLAALHNPDMIAAGKDMITGFGDSGINSSIGRQWQDRIGELDKEACKAKHEKKGDHKMNVELSRCKK